MSEIINGKEALIALANGEDVEYYKHEWMDVNRLSVRDLTSSDNMYKFRLKPRTITINGIEVPAPFERMNLKIAIYFLICMLMVTLRQVGNIQNQFQHGLQKMKLKRLFLHYVLFFKGEIVK